MSFRILGVALGVALLSSQVLAAAPGASHAKKVPASRVAKKTVRATSSDGKARQVSTATAAGAKSTTGRKPSTSVPANGRVAKQGLVFAPAKSNSKTTSLIARHPRSKTTYASKSSSTRTYSPSTRVARQPRREFEPIAEPVDAASYEELLSEGEEIILDAPLGEYSCQSCSGGGCLGDRCYQHRTWVRNEYILWWSKSSVFPPLVTTAAAGTAQSSAGIIGQSTTSVLFGDDRVDYDGRSGGRFTLGHWLDHCQVIGIEANFFALGDGSVTFDANSGGDPILARPFFNVDMQTNAAQLLAFPNIANGSVRVESKSEVLGAEFNVRHLFSRQCNRRLDLIMGYRFARFDDGLRIADSLTSTDVSGSVPVGTVIAGFDDFSTSNEFHGGQLGLIGEMRHCRWTVTLIGKLGLGSMHQIVHIDGATTVTDPNTGAVTATNGGLLTQPTNIGDFSRDRFAVIPEFGVNFRYDLSECLRLTAGYTFIYFNRVVRPDDQIDTSVNTTQIGGTLSGEARPATTFTETDYWLQGLSFGFEYWW